MKLEVNIEKKYALGVILSVLVLASVILVIAYTPNPNSPTPNPGHNLTSIQAYFEGESNLNDTLGKFCQADGKNCPPGNGGDGIGGAVQFYDGFLGSTPIGVHAYCALSKASWSGSSNCKCEVTGSKGGNWNLISTRCDSGGTVECSAVCINLP